MHMKKSVILCFCNVVLSLVLTLACIQAVPVQASPLQSKTITGVITSGTDGFPLIGVSVQVQENSTGSITDLDGRYSVQASEGQTLVFSYIGFKSQTIKIGTSSIINVVLIKDNEMLDEVVVVGYGVQKKKLVMMSVVFKNSLTQKNRQRNNLGLIHKIIVIRKKTLSIIF